MRIVPVIDLRGGRAVTGRSGERARYVPVTSRLRGAPEDLSDPRRLARAYSETLGSRRIYVADLDRIAGRGDNDATLAALLEDDPERELLWDGGLATADAAPVRHPRLAPILATETLSGPRALDAAFHSRDSLHPGAAGHDTGSAGRVRPSAPWLGLDLEARGPRARSAAVAAIGEEALVRRAAAAGAAGVVVVLLGQVGTGSGLPRARLLRLRAAAPGPALVAGGGIATLDDLLFLAGAGFGGALVATALHDGRLAPERLREAGLA